MKDDGCGQCPHNPWTAMRDALNKTGRRILYAIHAGNCEDWTQPVKCVNGSVANMWRCGNVFLAPFCNILNRLLAKTGSVGTDIGQR